MNNRVLDITGQKFGRLVAVKHLGKRGKDALWEFLCDCGNKKIGKAKDAKEGKLKSCGCSRQVFMRQALWKGYEKISGTHWGNIQREAKYRKIPFNLTIKEAWEKFQLQRGKCIFSGLDLTFATTVHATDGTASLDRIDSSLGYQSDNIQWIHKDLNRMKGNLSDKDFFNWVNLINDHKKRLTNLQASGSLKE